MRFLHSGDWHLGKKLRAQERWDEYEHALNEVLDVARRGTAAPFGDGSPSGGTQHSPPAGTAEAWRSGPAAGGRSKTPDGEGSGA